MLNWLSNLFTASGADTQSEALYQAVMKTALGEDIYRSKLAEDTFEGRFEAVTLHSALVLRRLRDLGDPGRQLADQLYRRVFEGFDHALRERGAGDSSIARKIRGYGERYFGLARAVDTAMATADSAASLEEVLVRNGVGGGATTQLSQYLVRCDVALSGLSLEAFQSGEIRWPDAMSDLS